MGGIIAAVVLIVVAIGFSAWWKGRLIGQGKIIQRAKDFVEYAEIFTTRPIANEEYVAALKPKQTAYIALSLIAGKQNMEGLPLKMK